MRAIQKIIRNGNSAMVTIPRPLLIHLEWLPGETLILELLEDKSIRIRRPTERDFAPVQRPQIIFETPLEVKP